MKTPPRDRAAKKCKRKLTGKYEPNAPYPYFSPMGRVSNQSPAYRDLASKGWPE
jgi:hypothetical protein